MGLFRGDGWTPRREKLDTTVTERFLTGNPDTPGGLVGAAALPDFVTALKKPRKIVILVKAGPPVDGVVEQLFGRGRR